jgi:aminocarboxymuconate-semialdehyde decarboxylase
MTSGQKDQIRLDIHAHLAPVSRQRLASFADVAWDVQSKVMRVDGNVVGAAGLFQPDVLLAWMRDNRVARAWISAPPPLYRQQLRGADSRAWASYLNLGLVAIARKSQDALGPLIHLPTEEPSIAAEIAAEWIGHGYRCFAMPAGTGDERGLGDTEFEVLWRTLNDAGAFVFFHSGECSDGRLKSSYLTNLLGNPYETRGRDSSPGVFWRTRSLSSNPAVFRSWGWLGADGRSKMGPWVRHFKTWREQSLTSPVRSTYAHSC